MSVKEHLLNTVAKLKEQGVDFDETPPLFTWTYPEEPDIVFQLLITNRNERENETLQ